MKVKQQVKDCLVKEGSRFRLAQRPTLIKSAYTSPEHYEEKMAAYRAELSAHQNLLFAHGRYSLLLIFQGMDTSGKDGAIKEVMAGVNPQSSQVHSFKSPSQEELRHDYLWRSHRYFPERGFIGIFNRSYYEEVLIARVDPEVLKQQNLPKELASSKRLWKERFSDIINMEDYLYRNGTRVVKFFLHISMGEQKKRILARIDDPKKSWKVSRADIDGRLKWRAYQKANEECLRATSRSKAPWYVIPADDKKTARLIISKVIVETLKALPLAYPSVDAARTQELNSLRRQLLKEKR